MSNGSTSIERFLSNPTGQYLPECDICYNEEIQDALTVVLEASTIESNEQLLERLREERRQAKALKRDKDYPKHGKPWTKEEKLKVILLNEGYNVWCTAKVLGRTPDSIRAKLKQIGIIPNEKRVKK